MSSESLSCYLRPQREYEINAEYHRYLDPNFEDFCWEEEKAKGISGEELQRLKEELIKKEQEALNKDYKTTLTLQSVYWKLVDLKWQQEWKRQKEEDDAKNATAIVPWPIRKRKRRRQQLVGMPKKKRSKNVERVLKRKRERYDIPSRAKLDKIYGDIKFGKHPNSEDEEGRKRRRYDDSADSGSSDADYGFFNPPRRSPPPPPSGKFDIHNMTPD